LSYTNILYEKRGAVAWVTLNRPQVLNALNRQTLLELEAALKEAAADPEVRVVVLMGAGERAFCVGLDLREVADKSPLEARELSRLAHRVFSLIESLPKPVVAAVHGYAMGGGVELALSCDLAIASEDACIQPGGGQRGAHPWMGGHPEALAPHRCA
jgi:enoyl-CoA hydratase